MTDTTMHNSPSFDGRTVVIVGAGVIGLTTAVTLAENGHHVTVLSDQPITQTTSAVAGALWGPWLVEPRDQVLALAADTLQVLHGLADEPGSGVRIANVREVSPRQHEPVDWAPLLTGRRPCTPDELPAGYSHGVTYNAPLVTMETHLPYLHHRAHNAGATFRTEHVDPLDSLAGNTDVIINATGIGAHDLVPDPDLHPIQGHHLIVTNPGLTDVIEADTGHDTNLLAIYPHHDTVILGGTAHPHQWNRNPDPTIAAAILERCRQLEPRLHDAEILDHRVGLRPTRPTLRLETTYLDDQTQLIHAYGHGGAGISLAWGTAHHITKQLETTNNTAAPDPASRRP